MMNEGSESNQWEETPSLSACAFLSKIYCDRRATEVLRWKTYNEEIEEMKNFVFGVFSQLVAIPFPPRMQQNNKETFR